MFEIIVEITKIYLGIVGILILIDLFSFLIAHWEVVLIVSLILALMLALFILVLPIIIIVKIIGFIF
ncbi:MAG: hypothetical protein J6Z43_10480 [Clostridiales bacterium]|nr:hypothetical protein [Clostridiales bacterium]